MARGGWLNSHEGGGDVFQPLTPSIKKLNGTNEPLNCDRAIRDTRMSRTGSERINGDRINGLFDHLLIYRIYWEYNPLILTIDPNFLGHPSTQVFLGSVHRGYCTSSARTSRGRKFPKGKELYSKERICL